MKLFISYSHDDKAWVYELWRALRDRAYHDAWLDKRVIPAQDWWESILQNIEACECFLYVMSPKSVESIYCQAEVGYAIALNKPILPLMLKPCDYPTDLKQRRIQHHPITDGSSLGDVLFTVATALGEIRLELHQSKWLSQAAERPAEPKADKKPEQVSEVYMLAEEAAAENNFSLAEQLFQQVMAVDPQEWGQAAAERLTEIRVERKRSADYLNIVQMASNPVLVKGARSAAPVFIRNYPNYDPNQIFPGLLNQAVTPVPPPPQPQPRPKAAKPVRGTRIVWSKGVTMVKVPVGKFLMGSTKQQVDEAFLTSQQKYKHAQWRWFAPELPQHEMIITQLFWLDLTPVTNASYSQFMREKGYRTKEFWTEAGWAWVQQANIQEPEDYEDFLDPRQPCVGVSWFEAYAYCRWRGGRLPTEAEWEWAARGSKNRIYPWGNTFNPDCVIYRGNSDPMTATVGDGIRAVGASWVGALDMSGNVWEWCSSIYRPYPYQAYDGRENTDDANWARCVRGGAWGSLSSHVRAAHRSYSSSHSRSSSIGFRVAVDASPF